MHVEILDKRYPLIPLDPMPVDVRIRRVQIAAAAQQAAVGGVLPYEVLLELGAACLGLCARGLATTPWRTPVGVYGVAVMREIVAGCPAEVQDRALVEIQRAGIEAWTYLAPLGQAQASEAEVAAAEGFSGADPANTPR
jgi:hypothetical protein